MTPKAPSIRSLPRTLQAEALTSEALQAVHDQTIAVLEKVGVGVGGEAMCRALADAGADVDLSAKRVRFPAQMVEGALDRAPRTYTLAARVPDIDLSIDGQHSYLAVDGCAAEILDHETGERRPSTKRDLALAMRLADALPEIGILWQPMSARDVPRKSQSLHELHAQFTNSGKHIQMMTAVTPEVARGVVEIARVVAGGSRGSSRAPDHFGFRVQLESPDVRGGSFGGGPGLCGGRRSLWLRRHADLLCHWARDGGWHVGAIQCRDSGRNHGPTGSGPGCCNFLRLLRYGHGPAIGSRRLRWSRGSLPADGSGATGSALRRPLEHRYLRHRLEDSGLAGRSGEWAYRASPASWQGPT